MPQASHMVSELAADANAVTSELTDPVVVDAGLVPVLVFTIFSIWLLGWAGRWASRFSWRLGFFARRTLPRVVSMGQWAIGLSAAAWALKTLLAPLSASAFSATVMIGMVLVLLGTGMLSDIAGGLSALFRLSLREGDQLAVGAVSGEVKRVYLTRIHLRSAEGEEMFVPARKLLAESVEVSALRRAYPVLIKVAVMRPLVEDELARIKEQLTLLPYRVPQSPLNISQAQQVLEISCHVWQQQAVAHVEKAVTAACRRILQDADEKDDG